MDMSLMAHTSLTVLAIVALCLALVFREDIDKLFNRLCPPKKRRTHVMSEWKS